MFSGIGIFSVVPLFFQFFLASSTHFSMNKLSTCIKEHEDTITHDLGFGLLTAFFQLTFMFGLFMSMEQEIHFSWLVDCCTGLATEA